MPVVSGSPLLVDWFANRNAIGRKWFISKGKKDNVEDSIAKFNGINIYFCMRILIFSFFMLHFY